MLSQAQITRNEVGEILVYDFNKRNKTNASEYKKKERLDNRSLKYILVCSIAEYFYSVLFRRIFLHM